MSAPPFSSYAANLARVNRALVIHRLVIGAERHTFPIPLVDGPFAGRPLPSRIATVTAAGAVPVRPYAPQPAYGLPNFRLPNGQVRK